MTTPFIRTTLPETVAAVAVRERGGRFGPRAVELVLVQLTLPNGRAEWAADLAFSRMAANPEGPLGLVMVKDFPAPSAA